MRGRIPRSGATDLTGLGDVERRIVAEFPAIDPSSLRHDSSFYEQRALRSRENISVVPVARRVGTAGKSLVVIRTRWLGAVWCWSGRSVRGGDDGGNWCE